MIIGITGTIGSGKTTVSRVFEKYGFLVIDADDVGHKFLQKGTHQYLLLVKYFGAAILDEKKEINRKKFGGIAFSEKKNYRALNLIMLPPILKEIKKIIEENKTKSIAIDAPILLETKAKELVDKVVLVKTSERNIFKRNKRFSKMQILNIKRFQMPIAQKLKHADFVINNDGNIKSIENQVINIIKNLTM